MPGRPQPHRTSPGALSEQEREQARALGREAARHATPEQVLALREGFAPAVRALEEERLRAAGIRLGPDDPPREDVAG